MSAVELVEVGLCRVIAGPSIPRADAPAMNEAACTAQQLDPVSATDLTTANLFNAARHLGLVISADNRVNEKGAALLLGCSHASLKAMRQKGDGPVFYAVGVDGSQLSYRLNDLAAWVEAGREDVMRRFTTVQNEVAGY